MSQASVNSVFTEPSSQTVSWTKLMEDIKNLNPEIEKKRQDALSALLEEWEAEDLEEQQETWEFLKKSLNEDEIRI